MRTHLEKRVPADNMFRFYHMAVVPNLFGEWTLLREWGRIGRGGQVRLDLFVERGQAERSLQTLERAKRRRGYVAAGPAAA